MTTTKRQSHLRSLFLTSVGVVFLIAHLSYFVQYPGLLSKSGVEPSGRILPRAFPGLDRLLVKGGWIDTDDLCELACFLGVLLSCAVSSGLIQHASLFILLTVNYYFLTVMGGSMYTFQWDTLLAETGFVTAACCAPWLRMNLRGHASNTLGTWPVRFLLFKLMFMSGVVKIQANCPTWLNLTALEYHFATQCLPGPFAWHAHQLPPFFLRLSVAAMFVIEIPAAFLLIAPFVAARRIGAILQITLQVVIILTGNYTFFNILTIALCLPCLETDQPRSLEKQNGATENQLGTRIQHGACCLFLWWASSKMFLLEYVNDANSDTWHTNVKLTMSKAVCDELIESTIPVAVPATLLFLVASSIKCCLKNQTRCGRVLILIQLVTCSFCIGIASIPLLDLTPKLSSSGFIGSDLFSPMWYQARRYHISNGYGLFRRMTGVGSFSPASDGTDYAMGWAGLPPSVVARPEIILEAKLEDANTTTSDKWHELNFRWKPGDVFRRPRQVAPHQPRLDWRMWFAALGHYQHNPWFISLSDKLLQGCPLVIDLLDEPEIKSGARRITSVRSKLYHYDFTRIDTKWSRSIPDVALLEDGKGKVRSQNAKNSDPLGLSSLWTSLLSFPQQYWTRQFVREYTPPINAKNQHPSVVEFLSSAGYTKTCEDPKERCKGNSQKGVSMRSACKIATTIRDMNLIWAPIAAVAVAWAWCFKYIFSHGCRGDEHVALCNLSPSESNVKKVQ